MKTDECDAYLNDLLSVPGMADFAPNGLQIEGKDTLHTIVTGVTASQALLDAAVTHQADAVMVHHGFFFKGEPDVIVGMKRQRIATLLQHNINLFAYHLPLDVHPTLGNNVLLAAELGIEVDGTFAVDPWEQAGCYGHLPSAQSGETLAAHLASCLDRQPLYIAANDHPIKTVAWATGAAQDYIVEAAKLGVDAFITGEASERTCHYARELGVHFFAAGHHATERYGIKALGEHLAKQFDLQAIFIDIDNPI